MNRKILARIHLWLAFIFGLPLIIVSLTGVILSYERELERWLHPKLHKVVPMAERVPVQQLYERGRTAFPELKWRLLYLPQTADGTVRLQSGGGVPTQVFLNPYSGEIVGSRTMNQSVTVVSRVIHTTLLAGKWGSRFTGLCSLMLLVSLVSGIYLWWSSSIRKRKSLWQLRRERGWFVFNYDLHNLVGVLMALPLMIIALTGAVFSFPEVFRPLIYQVTFTEKEPPRPTKVAPLELPGQFDLDRLLTMVAEVNPETVPTIIAFPQDETSSMRINQRAPWQAHYTGRHYTFLDPWREVVLENRDPEEVSLGTKMIMANRVLHTGELGGFWLRLLFMVASLAATVLVVGGFTHWYVPKRKRAKQKARSHKEKPRLFRGRMTINIRKADFPNEP